MSIRSPVRKKKSHYGDISTRRANTGNLSRRWVIVLNELRSAEHSEKHAGKEMLSVYGQTPPSLDAWKPWKGAVGHVTLS